MRCPLQSEIKVIEHDLAEIGKRIIETNVLADQYDGHTELIKERKKMFRSRMLNKFLFDLKGMKFSRYFESF